MKQTINKYQFRDAFLNSERDYYSYAGYEALFDFLEEVDPDFELDVVAITCDFTEYESAVECMEDLGHKTPKFNDNDEEVEEQAIEWLRENTCVIEFTGGIIIQAF